MHFSRSIKDAFPLYIRNALCFVVIVDDVSVAVVGSMMSLSMSLSNHRILKLFQLCLALQPFAR